MNEVENIAVEAMVYPIPVHFLKILGGSEKIKKILRSINDIDQEMLTVHDRIEIEKKNNSEVRTANLNAILEHLAIEKSVLSHEESEIAIIRRTIMINLVYRNLVSPDEKDFLMKFSEALTSYCQKVEEKISAHAVTVVAQLGNPGIPAKKRTVDIYKISVYITERSYNTFTDIEWKLMRDCVANIFQLNLDFPDDEAEAKSFSKKRDHLAEQLLLARLESSDKQLSKAVELLDSWIAKINAHRSSLHALDQDASEFGKLQGYLMDRRKDAISILSRLVACINILNELKKQQ